MTANDPLHGGKSDAGPRELVIGVEALEGAEQLVRVGRIKSRPVIPDKTGYLAFLGLGEAKLDFGIDAVASEFPRVADQVVQDRPQQLRIAVRRDAFRNR